MGSFFTNVQVHAGGRPAEQVRAGVVEAVRDFVLAGPYAEAAEGEKAARAVAIGPAGPEPWVAVFDQATEDQDTTKLDALAERLSSALGAATVSILVHDSDVLDLRLFQDGRLVDEYNNAPDYFGGEVTDAEREAVAGHEERWQPVLLEGKTPADLRAVWAAGLSFDEEQMEGLDALTGATLGEQPEVDVAPLSAAAFAETIPRTMADVVGWHPLLSSLGYDYLEEAEVEGLTLLRFRRA